MSDTATVDLSEAATLVVPRAEADVPVLGREHIVATGGSADTEVCGERVPELLNGLLAWHNRRPWARRLRPEQVGQTGVVRLAFEKPQAESGNAVLLKPLFLSEKLVAGQSAKQLLAFVRLHGFDESPAPADWPVRELGPAGAESQTDVHWRYVLSSAYPAAYGKLPLRALLGRPTKPGDRVPVGGRRALSLPRVSAAVAVLSGLLLAGVLGWRHGVTAPAVVSPAVAASAATARAAASAVPAQAATRSASAAALQSAVAAAAVAVPATTAGSAKAMAAAEAASVPAPAARSQHPAETPHATVAEPEATKAEEPKAAEPPPVFAKPAPERPLPKPRPTIRPIHAPLETYDPAAANRPAAKPEPAGPNFALVTAVSVDSEPLLQLRRRLRQAMGREGEGLQLELQQAPGGQMLALWPIRGREDATRLADTLRQAGIRMRLVEF